MKILHYIEKLIQGDLTSDIVSSLIASENHNNEAKLVQNLSEFTTVLGSFQPDIVHIHACWQKNAHHIAKLCGKKNLPIVLSTHWGLNYYARANEQHIEKLFKAISFQYKLVKQVDAILLDDEKEKEALLKLAWKQRIDLLPTPVLDKTITEEDEEQKAISLYNKVLATRYQYHMSAMEVESTHYLLHAGLKKENSHNLLPSNQLLTLRELNPEQWRRIFLYADDEGIRSIVDHSIEKLQLNAPAVDTALINRYSLLKPKDVTNLSQSEVVEKYKKEKLSNKVDDLSIVLQDIIAYLFYAKQLCRKQKLSLHHLAEIYDVVRFNDYDEDELKVQLKHLKLYKFARRIVQILKDFLQLEEGFMPITPLDDKGTTRIKKNFAKRK